MGDVQGREPRRNLIVTSTPTTDTQFEEQEGTESPTRGAATAAAGEKDSSQPAQHQQIGGFADPSQEAAMYGPTIAVYPQWHQMSHQSAFVAHNAHTRFVPAQNAFGMQSLQRSLPSPHQGQPQHQHPQQQQQHQQYAAAGPTPQSIPYAAGQSHHQTQFYGVPTYNGAGYYDPYSSGGGFHSPPGAHQPQNQHQQQVFPMPAYSSSYPPQSHSAAVAHGQSYVPWSGVTQQPASPYYYVPHFQQQQLSPQQMHFNAQSSLVVPYGPRRQSVPPTTTTTTTATTHNRGAEYDGAFETYRGSGSPRSGGFTSRAKRPLSTLPLGKSASPSVYSASVAGSSSAGTASAPAALHPSLPRGPPRKPRQSGHALWVGNLPPGTNVVALKDYFSTEDIESVFLISKSNCAFVNYRTEAACSAAMARFHDSRFQGVRLVCRLRRNSSPGTQATNNSDPALEETIKEGAEGTPTGEAQNEPLSPALTRTGKERFFIVKSLTVEDLDLSVRNGVWATQAHNEALLNAAYETAESVFLVFSANKSGEYYGYARMSSAISEEIASKIEWAPVAHTTDDPDLPKAIFTPATDTAPKGRIIDDSARGTIFWEAIDDDASDDESGGEVDVPGENAGISKSWGKPFRVEWMSTSKVPFYRTRGLRNPYNVSREVKIARDGTELEPSVGRRLLQMFHKGGLGGASIVNTPKTRIDTNVVVYKSNPVADQTLEADDFPSSPGPLETPTDHAEQVPA